jgi:YggT family protein
MGIILRLISFYELVIIARAISSFFPITSGSPFAPIVDLLYKATEPVFQPIRRVLPPMGGFDFTPLIVLIALNLIAGILG